MKRIYESLIKEHCSKHDEMLFFSGPRQVGKTTTARCSESLTDNYTYLTWDVPEDRDLILSGPRKIAEQFNLEKISRDKPLVVFDELHKYSDWKNFLKGFFDLYHTDIHIVVTGSSRLDIFKLGGDSLMGRYLLYRMHPLSVSECLRTDVTRHVTFLPQAPTHYFDDLLAFGGFPKPFTQKDPDYHRQWLRLRKQQLFREDIRDLTRVQELSRLELLSEFLAHQAGQLVNYSSLARKIRVSSDTVRRWIKELEAFYYCFTIKPWSKNVPRALLKDPKVYLWDWSVLKDPGARAENFIASHLLKAVHFWTDRGYGEYGLFFVRNQDKKEVDFLVVRDGEPWFLVEVKQAPNKGVSKTLRDYHRMLGTQHAFQVVIDMEYVDQDCFAYSEPVIVPARTFLSQLI